MVEKQYRSLIKATSWRALGTLDTIVVSFVITGEIKLAVSIGGIELFTKIFLYYVHERLWNRISIGREPAPPEYQI